MFLFRMLECVFCLLTRRTDAITDNAYLSIIRTILRLSYVGPSKRGLRLNNRLENLS